MKSLNEIINNKPKKFTYELKQGESIRNADNYGAFIYCDEDHYCKKHGKVTVKLKYVWNSGIAIKFCPFCEKKEEKVEQEEKESKELKVLNKLDKSGLGKRYYNTTKDNLKKITCYSRIENYLKNLNLGVLEDLIIMGSEKSGKSLICSVIVNEFARNDNLMLSVKYIFYNDLIAELKSRNKDNINTLKDIHLLLIDDVNINDNTSKSLFKSFIDYRYSNMLQTVIVVDSFDALKYYNSIMESAVIIQL